MRRFVATMAIAPADRILDVGGTPVLWLDAAILGPKITFLNIEPLDRVLLDIPQQQVPDHWTFVQGDGRAMTFRDQDFDVVFSNSVIEHVGSLSDQLAFGREIRRVGAGYWVQTPNRRFPVEPHFNFPFLQFLPGSVAEPVALRWPLSYARRYGDDPLETLRGTRLMSLEEVRSAFPDADVWHERMFGLTKSFVMVRMRRRM